MIAVLGHDSALRLYWAGDNLVIQNIWQYRIDTVPAMITFWRMASFMSRNMESTVSLSDWKPWMRNTVLSPGLYTLLPRENTHSERTGHSDVILCSNQNSDNSLLQRM